MLKRHSPVKSFCPDMCSHTFSDVVLHRLGESMVIWTKIIKIKKKIIVTCSRIKKKLRSEIRKFHIVVMQ